MSSGNFPELSHCVLIFFYSSVKMSCSPKPNFFLILVHTVNWNKLLELRSIGLLTSLIEISFPWLCVSHKTSIWLTDTSRTRVHSELEKNMVLNRCSDVISNCYPKTRNSKTQGEKTRLCDTLTWSNLEKWSPNPNPTRILVTFVTKTQKPGRKTWLYWYPDLTQVWKTVLENPTRTQLLLPDYITK